VRTSFAPFSFVVIAIAGWMSRHQQEVIAYLIEENRVLREQVGDRRLRFNDDQRRRLAAKAKKLGRKTLRQVATIAATETLFTWHRKLIVQNAESPCRSLGRPPTAQEIAALAVRMAEENRSWGYRRIQGALANLGHDLAHNTIRNILKRHGIEPAPERSRKTSWKEFLDRHWEQIMTSDFFRRNSSNRSGLGPVLVLLGFMKPSTRRVDSAGTACGTDGLSTTVIACKMRDNLEGSSKEKRDLIAEEPSRTCCHDHLNLNKPHVGIRLIVPLPASNQKTRGVRRRTRRDRLLNHDQCEAA
jgi:putative transposase